MSQKLELIGSASPQSATPEGESASSASSSRHRALARRYTPLLKYLATEKAVEIARRNMQIHGGVGYTREFGAEKLLRDALVLPIYEGTSQIQSLMAMKDTLFGIIKRPQAFVTPHGSGAVALRVGARSARAPRRQAPDALDVARSSTFVTRTAAGKLRDAGGRPRGPMGRRPHQASGTPSETSRWRCCTPSGSRASWSTKPSRSCSSSRRRSTPHRRELLERWLERAELRSRALYEEITTTGERILSALASDDHAGKRLAAE